MGEKPRESEFSEEENKEAQKIESERKEELRQVVENNFGKEVLATAEHYSDALDETIKNHLLEKGNQKGAEDALDAWREFINRIQTRVLGGSNKSNPEMAETVLRMAAALVAPETGRDEEDAVREGMKIIKARYGHVEE